MRQALFPGLSTQELKRPAAKPSALKNQVWEISNGLISQNLKPPKPQARRDYGSTIALHVKRPI